MGHHAAVLYSSDSLRFGVLVLLDQQKAVHAF